MDIFTNPNAGDCTTGGGAPCTGTVQLGTGSGFNAQTTTLTDWWDGEPNPSPGCEREYFDHFYFLNDVTGNGVADFLVFQAYEDVDTNFPPDPASPENVLAGGVLVNQGDFTFDEDTATPGLGTNSDQVPSDNNGDGISDGVFGVPGDFNGDGGTI